MSLGTLELVARDAMITGRITTTGAPASAEGIPVIAWRPGVPGSVRAHSGPGGIYALAVSSGTWQVRPAPTPRQPFVFTGEGREVTVGAGQVITGVDFALERAEATIAGVLVDADGRPVADAQGWATAHVPPARPGGMLGLLCSTVLLRSSCPPAPMWWRLTCSPVGLTCPPVSVRSRSRPGSGWRSR
ncbi:MAG: hypothetical protein Q9O62_04695 [Ardenticatenia bacterium]|nr:hypothetical protein [Ardenticatenia bacterium]